MRLALVALLLSSAECLDIDNLLSALDNRSTSLNRQEVVEVVKNHATRLNVTAQAHIDACSDIVELISASRYAPNDTILTIMNFTEISEIFDFIVRNEARAHDFVFEKLKIIRKKMTNIDITTDILVERMVNQISIVAVDIGKLDVVQDQDIDRVINKLKSKLLSLYAVVPSNSKLELERRFCAQTITDVLGKDPIVSKIIEKFAAAESIFMDDFVKIAKKRGNFTIARAIEIMKEEANRVGVPVQSHIDQCNWAHHDGFWNFTIIDESLEEFNRNNLKGRQINSSLELFKVLREAPDAWNEVAASMNFIETGLSHLSEKAKLFIYEIGQSIENILIDAVNNPVNSLTSWGIIEKMKKKITDNYKELAEQDQNDLEREFCLITSIRILNGRISSISNPIIQCVFM